MKKKKYKENEENGVLIRRFVDDDRVNCVEEFFGICADGRQIQVQFKDVDTGNIVCLQETSVSKLLYILRQVLSHDVKDILSVSVSGSIFQIQCRLKREPDLTARGYVDITDVL